MKKNVLVIAIDPGTGKASPTGLTVFDPYTKEIYLTENLEPTHQSLQHRLRDIADAFSERMETFDTELAEYRLLVCIESFIIKGKSGETLQRLIGALMSRLPYRADMIEVQNTTVKLRVGGHGHADKELVAIGVRDWFSDNLASFELTNKLLSCKEYDILDSLAIGVAGWLKAQELPKRKK